MRTSSSSTAQTVQTRLLPASANTTSALPQHQPPLYTMRNNFSIQQTNNQYKHKETTRGKRKKKRKGRSVGVQVCSQESNFASRTK